MELRLYYLRTRVFNNSHRFTLTIYLYITNNINLYQLAMQQLGTNVSMRWQYGANAFADVRTNYAIIQHRLVVNAYLIHVILN